MSEASVLRDLVIALCAAVVVLLPSRRLRLPPAVGFLITGTIIGPGMLGWIHDPEHVAMLAEVGVSVLLFVIGLEFSFARLREIGRAFLLAGPLQVLVTIAIVAWILHVVPIPTTLGREVFAGMLAALSSTAMLLPLLNQRGEILAPQGRLILGILLFQDFAMVPMLVLVPSLAGQEGLNLSGAALGLLSAAAIFLVARFVMPRFVNLVIRSGVRELYVMMAVAICLGASLATKSMGLSPALGAFLAGILVSESEYAHQIIGEILPFRDLFTSLFFVSIGMLLIPAQLMGQWVTVGKWLFVILVVKAIVAGVVVMALGFPLRIAAVTGISLAQVGEFSFVLASVGAARGLLTEAQEQQFLAVAVLSLALTPFLVKFGAWAGRRAGARAGPAVPEPSVEDAAALVADHVIIVGFGINGRNLARVLRETGIPYVILEMNPVLVRRARREGLPVHLGDASRRESFVACGLSRAAVVVLAISDPTATRVATALVHESNPKTHIVARTRLVSEVAELMKLGADEVIPEEFETSIAIFSRVLSRYHVPNNVIRLEERALRQEGYGFLREDVVGGALSDSVARMISGATTDTFYLAPDSPAVGSTLDGLHLRSRTGVLVIAVVRDGKHHLNPEPDYVFRAGDVLVLVGDHAALESAFEALSPAGTR